MVDNMADIKLLRTEVDSLSGRVQRLNVENDDLLRRLSEAKHLKEQRERQFEEEKSQLTKRIRELELSLKDGTKDVAEMQEKINNERKEHQVNQKVLCLEIEHLKSKLESLVHEIAELKSENDYIRRNTVSAERELELRKHVDELTVSLERETKSNREKLKEMQTQMTNLIDSENDLKKRLDDSRRSYEEAKNQLERERKKNQELQQESSAMKHSQINKENELKAEIDRLSSSLTANERLLEETRLERKTLFAAKEELYNKICQQDLEFQSQIEKMTSTLNDKERTINETNWRKRELMTSLENLERNHTELKKSLSEARTRLQELEEKNGKLERAIIRQKFEKDDLVSKGKEDLVNFDGDLRHLVREQESHINDLQREVQTLKTALKDSRRNRGRSMGSLPAVTTAPPIDRSPRRASLERETARLTKAAAAAVNGGTSHKQLQLARSQVENGAKRIAQLERWLDEIYNDRELGLGPPPAHLLLPGQSSRPRPILPGLGTSNGGTATERLTLDLSSRPSWDHRTKLTAVVGRTED